MILYELLAGRRPFVGEGVTGVLYKIIHEDPPELELGDLGPEGEGLRDTLRRTLAKDREQRPAGATRLADELSGVLGGHMRTLAAETSPEARESVALSRHLLKEGRVEESVRRLREVTDHNPHSLEARRALRAATREMQRRQQPAAPAAEEDFPELAAAYPSDAATYQPAATRVEAETVLQPTVVREEPHGARRPGAAIAGAAAVVAAAVIGAVALLGRRPPPVASSLPTTPPPSVAPAVSGPPPMPVAPPPMPPETTAEPTVAVPEGKVTVLSAYPLDVMWRGKLLARGQTSPQVSLPAGRQVLSLVAPAYGLRSNVSVDVRPGAAAGVEAPALGRISIRANPDNCQVFVDGAFLDYPPILDKQLAVGPHVVEFRWPDGARRQVEVDLTRGAPGYVMGRKE